MLNLPPSTFKNWNKKRKKFNHAFTRSNHPCYNLRSSQLRQSSSGSHMRGMSKTKISKNDRPNDISRNLLERWPKPLEPLEMTPKPFQLDWPSAHNFFRSSLSSFTGLLTSIFSVMYLKYTSFTKLILLIYIYIWHVKRVKSYIAS